MIYNNKLLQAAGKRQKTLLNEMHALAIIVQDRETGLWQREGLNCPVAKDLLKKTDKTLREQIEDMEPHVLRLENDAAAAGASLSGAARARLEKLKATEKFAYEEIAKLG